MSSLDKALMIRPTGERFRFFLTRSFRVTERMLRYMYIDKCFPYVMYYLLILVQIAFGSYFWPKGDSIWKILEVIVELNIPFVSVNLHDCC